MRSFFPLGVCAVLHKRRLTHDIDNTNQHLLAIGVGQTKILSQNEMGRLLRAIVDRNIARVEVRSTICIPNGIQPSG